MSREESHQDHPGEREGFYHLSWYVPWYRCDHWMGSNIQPRLRKPGWYRSYVSLSSLLNIAHRLTQPFQPTKVHPPVAGSCPDGTYPSWCDSWEGNELGTKLYLAALTPGPLSSVDLVGWDAKSEIWNVDPDWQPNVCVCVCYSIQRTSLPLGDKLVPSMSSWRLAERIRPSGLFQNHSTNNLITLVGWTLRSSAEKRMFYWNWPTDILGWRCIISGTTLADSLDRQLRLPKTKYWLIRQLNL